EACPRRWGHIREGVFMKSVLRILAVVVVLALAAVVLLAVSLPPSVFLPPDLGRDKPVVVQAAGLGKAVDVLYDRHAMPHLFGETDTDLAYALGFVHARDRLFQLDVIRHAALGRLTELFGKDLLDVDKRMRILTHNIEAQLAGLSKKDRDVVGAYAAGVNAGAEHAGRPMELRLLGVDFEPFLPLHSIAIARLQAWDLALDHSDELFRARIRDAIGADDPRMASFLTPTPSGGVPIVDKEAHSGSALASLDEVRALANDAADASSDPAPAPEPAKEGAEHGSLMPQGVFQSALAASVRPFVESLAEGGQGASNSWVVGGAHTESGAPMLSNDPHLKHRFPSVFYLAHLEHPEFTVAGVTFPGIPAVLIGVTRHFAWGMTTSFVDAQDLVELDLTEDGSGYRVDGAVDPFEVREQTFRMGKGDGAESVAEPLRVSRYGPVLMSGFASKHPRFDRFALKWVAFESGAVNNRLISGFWSFYRAKSIEEVHQQVAKMSFAGQNMALAFTDGTIAYRLASAIPIRASDELTHLPRDGRSSKSDWLGYLSADYKPQLANPEAGYIVSSNQRVVDDDWPAMKFAGGTGAMYYRAKRIDERIQEQLGRKKFSPSDFLSIQLDATSVEARRLAPMLGERCPDALDGVDSALLETFCTEVRGFDGEYDLDTTGALPFTRLMQGLRTEVLAPVLGEEAALNLRDKGVLVAAVEAALEEEFAGRSSPLFADGGFDVFLSRALRRAIDDVVEEAGLRAQDWRWGVHHTLVPTHPLEKVPVVGSVFAREPRPVTGYGETVRAEDNVPATHGSALRFVAELTDPPRARMVIDAGNSGHPGSPHYDDQREAWEKGEPFDVVTERAKIEAQASGRLRLTP
ncbi:MAG: penicillin acylase family protein, partial [Myxococcota bacterium]